MTSVLCNKLKAQKMQNKSNIHTVTVQYNTLSGMIAMQNSVLMKVKTKESEEVLSPVSTNASMSKSPSEGLTLLL